MVSLGLCLMIYIFIFYVRATRDLPSIDMLAQYRPPIMSRVHAGDGKLINEFAKEARVFVPIEAIPRYLKNAFVAAEDQRFYNHDGFDEKGFIRAMWANFFHILKGERLEGGSTITQQVAKNFLVGNERNVARKLREIVIARRIEKALDKPHILELYLNDIYFGRRAYGVAAAALNYFGKSLAELSLSEIAYLALLPKGPNNYRLDDPVKKRRALLRRNYVLDRMVEDNYISREVADESQTEQLEQIERFQGDEYLAAEYFVEETRKQVFALYGENELYSGGLSIRTTLDTQMQLAARRALRQGLEDYDRRHGYRGALHHFIDMSDWQIQLADIRPPADIKPWRLAVVLNAEKDQAVIGFTDETIPRGVLNFSGVKWAAPVLADGNLGAAPQAVSDVLLEGDVILVAQEAAQFSAELPVFSLKQVPQVNGALIAIDPHTGRVLSLVGGYSFVQSQFNRATQAYRQPGSAFKPFVYAAALDNDYTPASTVLDAPFVIERRDVNCKTQADLEVELKAKGTPEAFVSSTDFFESTQQQPPQPVETHILADLEADKVELDEEGAVEEEEEEVLEERLCERFYKPDNYVSGRWYGLSTLRLGIEQSRNAMTVRLANDIGMRNIADYARRFGIYENVRHELAWALGAGETTLLRMVTAYSILINGGKRIIPTILDRVQDNDGQTIFVHGDQACNVCQIENWNGQLPPDLGDKRPKVIDPVTAYQITHLLKGVIDNGTGRRIRSLGYPLGGKTGTTNDAYDTWFIGFSPDLVAGIYVGYDRPRSLGARETGSTVAAPIFKYFMKDVLKGQDKVPFRIPEDVILSPINRKTGKPSYIGAPNYILEAFRPGTEPHLGELPSTIRIGSGQDSYLGQISPQTLERSETVNPRWDDLDQDQGDDLDDGLY